MVMELITILIQILGALFVYRIFLGFAMTIFSGIGGLPVRVLQKFKINKSIQKIDDLQKVIALCSQGDYGIPLQFINMR